MDPSDASDPKAFRYGLRCLELGPPWVAFEHFNNALRFLYVQSGTSECFTTCWSQHQKWCDDAIESDTEREKRLEASRVQRENDTISIRASVLSTTPEEQSLDVSVLACLGVHNRFLFHRLVVRLLWGDRWLIVQRSCLDVCLARPLRRSARTSLALAATSSTASRRWATRCRPAPQLSLAALATATASGRGPGYLM